MTYEEKFDIVVRAIKEAVKMTPSGYNTKLKITYENKLQDLDLDDISSILYKLNDQEIIKMISTANAKFLTGLDPWSEEQNYYALDVLDTFESWYENYLLEQKTSLQNLDYINLLRIYDVVLNINEQIQVANKTTVQFPLLPSLIRFQILFPADTIGFREEYCDNRLNSLKYLKDKGFIDEYTHNRDGWDTTVTVSLRLSRFDDFYKTIRDEYVKQNKSDGKTEKSRTAPLKIDSKKIFTKVNYDPRKGEVDIEGKKVKFKKDSFRAKLLELLLKDDKNSKKEWSWDEIIEKVEDTKDENSTKENKKKFYPACDGLSKFIAQKTGINDLLIFNKSTVQINPQYLQSNP